MFNEISWQWWFLGIYQQKVYSLVIVLSHRNWEVMEMHPRNNPTPRFNIPIPWISWSQLCVNHLNPSPNHAFFLGGLQLVARGVKSVAKGTICDIAVVYIYIYVCIGFRLLPHWYAHKKKFAGDFVEFFTSRDGGLNLLKKKVGNLLQKCIEMIWIWSTSKWDFTLKMSQ